MSQRVADFDEKEEQKEATSFASPSKYLYNHMSSLESIKKRLIAFFGMSISSEVCGYPALNRVMLFAKTNTEQI